MWNRRADQIECQIRLTLIRHGKTPGNEEHRYIGRTDEALSDGGRAELKEKNKAGYYPDADMLAVSPMKRCRQTAEILYPEKEQICVTALREMDFGEFEGKNYEELQGDTRYQAWIDSGGALAFPGGESREAFTARCRDGLFSLLEELGKTKKRPEHIAAVVHGGTIMALLSSCDVQAVDEVSGVRGQTDEEMHYYDYQCANGEGFTGIFSGTFREDGTLCRESAAITDIRRLVC